MTCCTAPAAAVRAQGPVDPRGEPAALPAKPLPKPTDPAAVARGFLDHVRLSDRFDAQAAAFVLERADALNDSTAADALIDESLAILVPEFKTALDALTTGDAETARPAFERLTTHADPFVAVNAAFFAAQSLLGDELVRPAAELLKQCIDQHSPVDRFTTHSAELVFLLGYAQIQLLQYDRAEFTLAHYIDHFPDAPERFRNSARQMLTEIRQRRPKAMGDVHDLMNYARRELDHGHTDEDVRARQDEAVRLLDELIEQAEQQEQQQKQGQGDGRGGQKDGRDNPDSGPADNSQVQPGGGRGEGQQLGPVSEPGEAWGKMPDKDREAILQALQKQFPSQYRNLVEQYYRQLAKEKPAP